LVEVFGPQERSEEGVVTPKEDANYYYVDGPLGMKSNGAFTSEKRHWMTFGVIDARRMFDGDIKPYGATRKGVFVGTVSGNTLSPRLALTGQTETEIRAAEQAKKEADDKRAAEEKAAEDRRKADAERDDFGLTGSDRAADRNPGQGDIFAQAPPPTQQPTTDETPPSGGVSASVDLKSIKVQRDAVVPGTDRRLEVTQNADEALADIDRQLSTARALLQCLLT
jgi:hypothetical protein